MSSHTPGPWVYREANQSKLDNPAYPSEPFCIISGDEIRMDAIADSSGYGAWEVAWVGRGLEANPPDSVDLIVREFVEANVRLIAAAPDLLAACEALVDACDNGSRSAIECAEIARAAIAKAKGEAQ